MPRAPARDRGAARRPYRDWHDVVGWETIREAARRSARVRLGGTSYPLRRTRRNNSPRSSISARTDPARRCAVWRLLRDARAARDALQALAACRVTQHGDDRVRHRKPSARAVSELRDDAAELRRVERFLQVLVEASREGASPGEPVVERRHGQCADGAALLRREASNGLDQRHAALGRRT
jgi:hypothetical protein